MTNWLEKSRVANYEHPAIVALVKQRGWASLPPYERIGAAYTFVKDEILFGYNRSDAISASEVLQDGYGQCNTKGNLLVALLRHLEIPARFHGATIHKALQKGAIPSWLHPLAPGKILHSWVELRWEARWIALEGFILDRDYLSALQRSFPDVTRFCGYGAATPNLHCPQVEWAGRPTFIQREGLAEDFGVFDDPDDFYAQQGTNLSGVRRLLYARVFRHAMNATVRRIRQGRLPRRSGAHLS